MPVLNNLKKTTDHLSNITTITYDSLSRKTGMTDPDMGTWSYAYDANDNLTSQTDAKSQTISFTYDALNRVTLKNLPAGETDAAYTYDDALVTYSKGRLTKVTDGSGTHEFTYDALGRVLTDKKTVDAAPYTFTRTYDSMGRVRTLTYPDTEVVTYTYNNMGDVETIAGVKSGVTTHYVKDVDYNASGQITHVTYGNNVTSDYTYNAQTLRLSNILTKKPDGTTKLQDLSYTFDNNGNVTQISDLVNSMSQTFTYDDLNRLLTAIGSAYGSESYTYDAIGNMTSKDGQTMVYGEGTAGPHAVTSITSAARPTYCPPAPASCSMVYDANGNMTDRGQDELLYDSENRLKEMHHFEGTEGTHNFSLSEGWNLISFTYLPDNRSITSVLSSLTFGSNGYDQISYYDPASSSWKHFVNDPDFNDFSEFEAGRSYEIHVTKTGGTSVSVTGLSLDVDKTHTIAAGENFVSPEVKQAESISSLLSAWGLSIGTHLSDIKRLNPSTQQLESYTGGAFTQFEPKRGYIFVGLQSASFSYGETKTVTTFTYDSAGARVKKTVTGGTTSIYLGKDYEVEGATTTKHVFLGDRRITTKKSSGEIQYIHEDHINSSNIITDASGNQSALMEYSPYGATATHTGTVDPKHKFTGQEEDDTTALYYYNARYYDPQLGRFITADPTVQNSFDPQDLNRYAYARNNPIIFVDPSGLGFFKKFFSFVGAVIGAAIGNMILPGAGFFLGAVIGGALGGALGGTIDAAIEGKSLQQGAISGAIYGAITGALYAVGNNGNEKSKEKATDWINAFFKSSEVEVQQITIEASQQLGAVQIHFSEYATMGIYAAGIPSLSHGGEFSYSGSYRTDQKIVHFVGATTTAYFILQFALFRVLAPTAATMNSNQLGQLGERLAGINGKKVRIPSLTGTASYRVPDELLTGKYLREVKYAHRVNFTPQIQDFLLYARSKGIPFILETRPDTILSKAIQELVKKGDVIHKIIKTLVKQ